MQITSRDVTERVWINRIALAMAIALSLKLTLALTTYGTNDVDTWEHFLEALQEVGGAGVYYRYNVFNHPPFVLHLLNSMGRLATLTGIPFPFWLRFPAILADVGSAVVVWKIFNLQPNITSSPANLVFMAVAPVSIMVAGFHGNTDPIMIFILLLSIYMIASGQPIWLAGAAFGLSANIKVIPIILVPAIVLFLPDIRKRISFCVAAVVMFVFSSLPYILHDPFFILRRVLGYDSLAGQWGIPRLLMLLPTNVNWLSDGYAELGKYVVIGIITATSLGMNRRQPKPPLFQQCGLIMAIFMTLTPGFGVQYLAWLVPWVITTGVFATLTYYIASGIFLFLVYTYWAQRFPWQVANSKLWPASIIWFELVCWGSVVLVLLVLTKTILLTPNRHRMYR
jgi:hypothetical protein